MGPAHLGDAAAGRLGGERRVDHPDELAEVAADRRAQPGLAGGSAPPSALRFQRVLLVLVGGSRPLREPPLPPVDPSGGADEIVVVDAMGQETRCPVPDRALDPLIRHRWAPFV